MAMSELRSDVVVLAGIREVRIVDSTLEAESELARGFRPAVVLLGPGVRSPASQEFALQMGRHPSRASIPVLAVTGDEDRVRLTLVSGLDGSRSPGPEELSSIMMVLEELASELSLMDRWRRRDSGFVAAV
jgi:hypothetical protein